MSGPGIDSVVAHGEAIDLPVGTYTIEELVPAGFVKTDWRIGWYGACDAGSAYSTTITIDDGNVDHGWLDCQADNQYRPVNQPEIEGCTDPEADNYDPAADTDDGSCIYNNNGGGDETYLIEGYVWHDVDEDGVIDEDEDRLEDWEVQLLGTDNLATTSTDIDGYYQFVVTAGTYTLQEVVEENWQQVYPTPVTYVITVPEDIAAQTIPFPFNMFVSVAHAQTPVVGGPFNFGNIFTGNGGNGGNGSLSCTISADANAVAEGADVTLTWDATGATTALLNNGVGTTTATGSLVVSVTNDVTYTLTASDAQSTTTCSVDITVRSGGGGGSRGPVCEAFTLADTTFVSGATSTLMWETRFGNEVVITANGTEIFATTTDDVVDMGSTAVLATELTTYELTVSRGSRTDTCSVAHTRPGGGSGSSSGIGGGTPQI
ncbi:MAG TPA: SdrD B-like domain-containing protein, partial [Candidatus Paceibacterota bacterium]|nr:SdrD B-like domain-containing protein [Candidatus Paceibacterota bacterium]